MTRKRKTPVGGRHRRTGSYSRDQRLKFPKKTADGPKTSRPAAGGKAAAAPASQLIVNPVRVAVIPRAEGPAIFAAAVAGDAAAQELVALIAKGHGLRVCGNCPSVVGTHPAAFQAAVDAVGHGRIAALCDPCANRPRDELLDAAEAWFMSMTIGDGPVRRINAANVSPTVGRA
jgi:hypothetical protein